MTNEEIIQVLNDVSAELQSVGNKLRKLSTESNDIDIVTLISSLSTDVYNESVGIKEAIDDFIEILEEQTEDLEEI